MFDCNLCFASGFKSLKGLERHKAVHMAYKFPCSYCENLYRYKTVLANHVANKHGDELPIDLENLQAVFAPDSMIRYTKILCPNISVLWTCMNCLTTCLSENAAKAHVVSCATRILQECSGPSQRMENEELDVYKCQCCDLTFRRKVAFEQHLRQMKAKQSPSDSESDDE